MNVSIIYELLHIHSVIHTLTIREPSTLLILFNLIEIMKNTISVCNTTSVHKHRNLRQEICFFIEYLNFKPLETDIELTYTFIQLKIF